MFTDPLAASDPLAIRRRIRAAHGLVYGAAAPMLLLSALADGGPPAQRVTTAIAALATALMAIVVLAWRRAPDRLLLAAFPLAALTVTAIAVLDPPLALTPMYYVWPLMTAAYFLQRRELLITYAVVCLSFGAASFVALDGGPRLIQWVTVAIVGAVVIGFVATLKEALQRLIAHLRELASEDSLTGALNRRAFLDRLEAEIAIAHRLGRACAVAVIDVDHFKAINDEFGHAAGDEALRLLADTVVGRLRRGDALGRLGGEEFAVLLTGADGEAAKACAGDLRACVAEQSRLTDTPFTVSAGVASLAECAPSAGALLAAADAALYRAKRAGRNTVRVA